ncbi:AVIToxin-VAR1-like [Rhopilema esculentum]|uniref:AVIToxin-VAR1-like n=1 Tax=Rhopilema esculentum TaxID=499914 RepID=UPI0031D82CA3
MTSYAYYLLCLVFVISSNRPASSMMQPCEKNSQCGENQCCALRLKLFGYKGYCLRTKSLGEVCSPNVMNGKHFTCSCTVGLTCAITDLDKFKNPKYRCVRIPTEVPEVSERPSRPVEDTPQNSPYAIMFNKYLQSRLNRLRSESPRSRSS